MKILIYGSNPRLESGMGKVGVEISKGLAREGHEVHLFAPNEVGPQHEFPPDAPEDQQFMVHGQPNPGGPGVHMFQRKLLELQPDLVLTNRNWQSLDWLHNQLNDVYMNHGNPTPLLMYGPPIETERKPPLFEETILEDHLNEVRMVPYTQNRYHAMYADWGVEDYLLPQDKEFKWVPHGVDLDIFHPDADGVDGAPGIREGLGLGDRFVATMVGENWRRKNLDLLFDAWQEFRDFVMGQGGKRPFLLLHTDPGPSRGDDQFYSGWNIAKTAISYNLNVAANPANVTDEADVVTTKKYIGAFDPREVVAAHFAAADLMVLPTSGEGFSLTSLEAMACGCPILQTDLPTLRWLCQDASEYVETVQDHAINTGERMPTPSVDDLAQMMIGMYRNPDDRDRMSGKGRRIAEDFPWERTSEGLADAVEWMGETLI